ncbi:MAG: hypothetical protein JWP58_4117 [Hymenobacter sp.]|nr:hypothetical protein [Hymenobacter sp.]
MKHVFTPTTFLKYARRGALLALGTAGPAAWGQSFGLVSTYSTGTGSNPFGVAIGDVNGDGLADIVSANFNSSTAGMLLGQPTGGFAAVSTYSTGAGSTPTNVALGDVNGDGRLDIVTANEASQTAGVLLGQANGFAVVSTYSVGIGGFPRGVALGDVNGDGRPDIITTNYQRNDVSVLLGLAGGFAAVSSYSAGTSGSPRDVAVGDVNGDGRLDIVTANVEAATVGVLLGAAGGGFAAMNTYATGTASRPAGVALADVNGDGRLDIIAAILNVSIPDNVGVLLGRVSGGFAPVSLYPIGMSTAPLGVAVGDVNGDGWADIVTANFLNDNVGILLGNASGFAPPIMYATGSGSMPARVELADLNGDHRLDIITANQGASSVGVLLNTGTYTPLATVRPAAAADVTLAPNPAHDAFTVQLPAGLLPTSAELLNALGQVVRRPAVGAGSFTVATSGLAPGIYTLRLRAGGAALARRVVVE